MDGVSEHQARRAGFDPSDPRLARVLALARELMGFPRHLSQHVGGFVVTRSRLDEVVPIENAAMEDRTVIEWEKNDLEALGLLKVDVLGLGMLTCLRRAFDFLRGHYPDALSQERALLSPPPAQRSEAVGRGRGWGEILQSNAPPRRQRRPSPPRARARGGRE